MANTTDPLARTVHGTNPQNLMDKVLRGRVYASRYWKERCFGITAEGIIDEAVRLEYIGGSYSYTTKPTPFACLLLKMLQIQPEDEIVTQYIENDDFKYLRALGAMYLRLVGRPAQVYRQLEPLYSDYRKLVQRSPSGWTLLHMDEFIDELLTSDVCCGMTLPRLTKRSVLQENGLLEARVSLLDEEIAAEAAASAASAAPAAVGSREQPAAAAVPSAAGSTLREHDHSRDAGRSTTGYVREMREGKGEREAWRADGRRDVRRHDSRSPSPRDRDRGRGYGSSYHRRSRSRSRTPERRRDYDDRRYAQRDERPRWDRRGAGRSPSPRRHDERREVHNSRDDGRRLDDRSDSRRGEYGSDRFARPTARHRSPSPPPRGGAPGSSSSSSGGGSGGGKAPPAEGSVEYWNEMRAKLGLKPLK